MLNYLKYSIYAVLLACLPNLSAADKPLKVFILAGQSNMQGQAKVKTIARLNMTDDSKQMYNDMQVKNGIPSAVEGVHCVYFTNGEMSKGKNRPRKVLKGSLKPGLGSATTKDTRFGPEYTFGIYMKKQLNEPFLIIKTAWGGRSLLQQFRPPSAGKFKKDKDKHGNPTGAYYQLMVKMVKEVLADPGNYHPGYKKENGIEIAGFVWFQGFNDMVGPYPKKGSRKDFSEYTRLFGCMVRDLRKDLNAPKMPVVIGAIGTGGPAGSGSRVELAKAQMAVAQNEEFKGNVLGVQTDVFWDMEYKRIQKKVADKIKADNQGKSSRSLSKLIKSKWKELSAKVLTEQERELMSVATSDQGYHYLGSAYIYGNIGKAFADTMASLVK